MIEAIKLLWPNIPRKRKLNLLVLFFLTLISSLLEVFSIGAVFPFVTVFVEPSMLLENKFFKPYFAYYKINEAVELFLPITIAFFILTTLSYSFRLFLIYLRATLSRTIIHEISSLIYWRIINEPYKFHINHNSGDIITGITKSFGVASNLLLPIMVIINSVLMILFIMIGSILVDPKASIILLISLFLFYLVVIFSTNKRLKEYSNIQNQNYSQLIKIIQESIGAIKIMILNRAQVIFYKSYNKITKEYLNSISMVEFIGQIPKLIFEYLILITVVFTVYIFSEDENNLSVLIPLIVTFLFTIQKLLPIVNNLFVNITRVKSSNDSVKRVINYLNINKKSPLFIDEKIHKELAFSEKITLKDINFRYSENEFSLSKINLTIKKGQKIGFVGETGSGKSTLIDIISGILEPTKGEILIDNKELVASNLNNWKEKINTVSQNIFLFDSTIAENIAFCNDKSLVDIKKLEEVSKIAYLNDFIHSLENGYFTKIGERGIKISGGQMQRIGIARALYNNPEILILDEATSALDHKTEKKVMDNIIRFSNNTTLLIIAHRITTLQNCDLIFKINAEGLETYNSYNKFINDNGDG